MVSAARAHTTQLKKDTISFFSPETEYTLLFAMENVAIAVPFCVYRISGSLVSLPISTTLLISPAIYISFYFFYALSFCVFTKRCRKMLAFNLKLLMIDWIDSGDASMIMKS